MQLFNEIKANSSNLSRDVDLSQIEMALIKRLLKASICEELFTYISEGNCLFIQLKHGKKTIIAKDVVYFNLNKVQINGEIFIENNGHLEVLNSVNMLLDLIYAEIADKVEFEQWQSFVQEIENCAENDLLVTQFMNDFNRNLSDMIAKTLCKSLIEYIEKQYSPAEQLLFFEAWASQGHPYHPCHKTRLGFNKTDYVKYSPEFDSEIEVSLTAIKKNLLHIECKQDDLDYNEWFSKAYPEQWQAFLKKMKASNFSETDYSPIFIHPWQYENIVTTLFSHLIKDHKLIYFNDINISTKASISFRTLIPKDDPSPHIKLPIAIHSTSALRTIPPAAITNGPRLSKILNEILVEENYFSQHLKVAYESCSLRINDSDPELTKHLAVIYRENPANLVTKNQMMVPVAALYQKSPVTQLPLFIEIMHNAGYKTLNEVTQYFDQYSEIVIKAYLDIFLIYGIGLEGHQQNTIAVFENFKATSMIQRDLNGLRIHGPTLSSKGYTFNPFPNSRIISDDTAEATNKFLHAVVQYHLGEIGLLLSQYYQTSENVFWKIIKNNLEARFQTIKDRVDSQRWEQEYKAFLIDDWVIKCLLQMRLNKGNQYIYLNQKNPLRDI